MRLESGAQLIEAVACAVKPRCSSRLGRMRAWGLPPARRPGPNSLLTLESPLTVSIDKDDNYQYEHVGADEWT